MLSTPPMFSYDQVEMSYLDAVSDAELDRQREIVLARRYHIGDQDIYLSERAKQFLALQPSNKFRLNVCRSVVSAVSEKLLVSGFDTDESGDESPQSSWAQSVWRGNRMDAIAQDVHEAALRDGEHFVIVDWDTDRNMPRLTPHQRYASTEVEGDGFGCVMVYPDNNISAQPTCAIKQWTETIGSAHLGSSMTRQRRTLYYPDRIERYFYSGGWMPYYEEEKPWPTPWLNASGKPLGIPVIHFMNQGPLRCEAWDAIPLQDAINKMLVDTLATADLTAFRIYFTSGWIPTTDGKEPASNGSNWLTIAPGQLIGTTKPGAELKAIEPADISPLVEFTHQLVLWLAMVTDTPVSRFISSKAIASADTLKEQQEPLESKVELRQTLFGNAWEDVIVMARRLANTFGGDGLDEAISFSTLWYRKRSLDELQRKKELGVPLEMLWAEMGYSPEQIELMKATPQYQATLAMAKLGMEDGS